MTTNTMTKPRQILLDHISIGTTFYLTPQEKERLLECIKVVDSLKEALQSNYKCHQSDSVVEMVKDGGTVYEATVPEKKLLLELVYKIYEAGKKRDDGAFSDTRREILQTVYDIQRKSLTTLTQYHQDLMREVEEIEEIAKGIQYPYQDDRERLDIIVEKIKTLTRE